ncbi:MAG: molybdate ABC transporter substrate-binding protein [Actinomycetes bacterium]
MRHVGRATAVALLAVLTACGGSSSAPAGPAAATDAPRTVTGTVTVFAAASLTESFTQLAKRFEVTYPSATVRFSFAASSELATQVTQGAPADVFASASPATMQQVVDAGGVAGRPTTFVRNRLEIAVPPDNPGKVSGLADFARPGLRIALCAKEVPCGAAAVKAFAAAGITPRPDTYEQDVKAALTKVELGEVDAALVYRTDIRAAAGKVTGIEFPEAAKAVNDYPIAMLADAPNKRAARAWVDLVLSRPGAAVLARAGFDRP